MNCNTFGDPLTVVPAGSKFLGYDQILAKQITFPSLSALVGAN